MATDIFKFSTPSLFLHEYAKDSSGEINMNDNYSSEVRIFTMAPSENEVWFATRISVFACNSTGANFKLESYLPSGAGNKVLDAGILVRVLETIGDVETTVFSEDQSGTIKKWADYLKVNAIGPTLPAEQGSSNSFAAAEWEILPPMTLSGREKTRIEIVLNDDFSSLDEHLFHISGRRQPIKHAN